MERSFPQIKIIKTQLRNRLGEMSLSLLMKMAIESPHKKCLRETWKRSLMSGTESHDGLLCKISNLHALRGGGGGGGGGKNYKGVRPKKIPNTG